MPSFRLTPLSKSARAALLLLFLIPSVAAHGQTDPSHFATIINVPPNPAPPSIGSSTQLNLSTGGMIGFAFDAGAPDGSSVNVEVNIIDGYVNSGYSAYAGSTTNISGGAVNGDFEGFQQSVVNITGGVIAAHGDFESAGIVNISGGVVGHLGESSPEIYANSGSLFNVTGGALLGGFSLSSNSRVNISAGIIDDEFVINQDSDVNITGGTFGRHFDSRSGSRVTIAGGEFRLNGAPFVGTAVSLAPQDVFTGTLTDGSVVLFSRLAFDSMAGVTLAQTSLPPLETAPILVNANGPAGLRPGQSLAVVPGGSIGDHFSAVGANFDVDGGSVGRGAEASDSRVNIRAGNVGRDFGAFAGSEVNISGGSVGDTFRSFTGSVVNVSGGNVGNAFQAGAGSTVNVTGGVIGAGFMANAGSVVNISGGDFSGRTLAGFRAEAGSSVNFFGTAFFINGAPLSGMQLGAALTLRGRDVTLSGFYADGSSFSFVLNSRSSRADYFSSSAILTVTRVPAVPEPSTLVLLTGATGIFLRKRRRSSPMPDRQQCAKAVKSPSDI